MWDQESKGDHGPEGGGGGGDLGPQPQDQGSQAMGSRSAVFCGNRNQAMPFLRDQGPKSATLLESRIRN